MRPIVTDWVAWSVGLSVTVVSPAETAEVIEIPFGLRTRVRPDPHANAAILKGNGWRVQKRLNRSSVFFEIWTRVGPRKHVLGGVTLAPPGEYQWTVHVQRRCGLLSNYCDHLLQCILQFFQYCYAYCNTSVLKYCICSAYWNTFWSTFFAVSRKITFN